ncbi:MAG: hypothetical protein GY876_08870 [Planctomycetes bacterium]|nr:hypothetical protein [Planctomycetota bacterium]
MRPVLDLCGRLKLMGRSVDLLISGEPGDANDVIRMLHQLGVDRVARCRACDVDAFVGHDTHVYCASGGLGSTAAVVSALKYWIAGATLLLPAGHPASEWLSGLGGVIENVDSDPDAAVRMVLGNHDEGEDRSEVAEAMAIRFREELNELTQRKSLQ